MNTLVSVLEEIRSGKITFRPKGDRESDMRDFQPIAKLLIYAHQEGMITSCTPHQEKQSSHSWYDCVIVQRGLSHKGDMFLASPPSTPDEKELNEIVQIKPNIYGVGIDLKALWKRWKARKD